VNTPYGHLKAYGDAVLCRDEMELIPVELTFAVMSPGTPLSFLGSAESSMLFMMKALGEETSFRMSLRITLLMKASITLSSPESLRSMVLLDGFCPSNKVGA